VATLAGLKRTALLLQPPLELMARHERIIQHLCCVVNTSVIPPESSDEKANRRRPSRSESVEDATITTFGNHSSVVVSDSCGDEHSCYRPSPDPTLLLKADCL
jgi:hypothetical protein